jgi:hypothetical protein
MVCEAAGFIPAAEAANNPNNAKADLRLSLSIESSSVVAVQKPPNGRITLSSLVSMRAIKNKATKMWHGDSGRFL